MTYTERNPYWASHDLHWEKSILSITWLILREIHTEYHMTLLVTVNSMLKLHTSYIPLYLLLYVTRWRPIQCVTPLMILFLVQPHTHMTRNPHSQAMTHSCVSMILFLDQPYTCMTSPHVMTHGWISTCSMIYCLWISPVLCDYHVDQSNVVWTWCMCAMELRFALGTHTHNIGLTYDIIVETVIFNCHSTQRMVVFVIHGFLDASWKCM